jgi:hypothetical protein
LAEGCVTFIFDECLSDPIAEMLTHCGGKHEPQIVVTTLKKRNMLKTHDPTWVKYCAEKGWVIVSNDTSMIVDHDIARLVSEHGGTLFLLRPEVSQQRAWGLLRWYLTYLPKLAQASSKFKCGTTWLVGKDGGIHEIRASKTP